MNPKKAIKSVSLLWLGSFIGSGSSFLIYMILARKLGSGNFGLFSNVLAITTIFLLIAGFGTSRVWLKLFGSEGIKALRWVKPSLKFVAITLIIITLIIFCLVSFLIEDIESKKLLLLMIFHVCGYSCIDLVSSKLQLEENYTCLSLWQLLPNFTRLIFIAVGYYLLNITFKLHDIGFIYFIIGLVFSLLGAYQLYKMSQGNFALKGHTNIRNSIYKAPAIKDVLKETWPFGLAGLFAFIYVQSDIIIIKYLIGDNQAGIYNAAFIILNVAYTFPSILFAKFLMPKYHRWANFNRAKFYNFYIMGNKAMFFFGLLGLVVICVLSRYFIPLIFGNDYIDSIEIINILALTLPFQLVAFSVESTLVTMDNMKKKVACMGSVAIINVVFNFFLVPIYQAKGAAIATVMSNAILLCTYFYVAKTHVFQDKNQLNG